MTTPVDLPDENTLDEVVLPTFTVFARFRESAPDGPTAVRQVVDRLTAAREPFHEITVQEQDGGQLVLVRFVLVSIDAHIAVTGLSETLAAAGTGADEVWAGPQLP